MKYLDELKKLNLPSGQYAIFGSGPMAVRGIRDSDDIDIIIKKELWTHLSKKYPENLHKDPTCLKIGNIEIYMDWPNVSDSINKMINSAETINGLPYVRLEYVVEWKKGFGREKDKKDIELIKKYLKNKKAPKFLSGRDSHSLV